MCHLKQKDNKEDKVKKKFKNKSRKITYFTKKWLHLLISLENKIQLSEIH